MRDTPTARALWQCLPLESTAQTWGEEVYFSVPVEADLEPDARQTVGRGDVCFWTEGGALALPYGRTPLSTGSTPVLVSPCNHLGKLEDEPGVLATLSAGMSVRVEAVPA